MSLKRPFQLGSLTLPSNIFCAPLAGCSDLPFRKMLMKYRPGLMYCEMVKMEALLRQNRETLRFLDYEEGMHPIGAQLCGSDPKLAGPCARRIEEMGFDVVDLNCGCPVDKVTKDGSGSGLLKQPERIGEIVANMVAAVHRIPVTVKIRIGWDLESVVAPEVTRIVEQAGARAICIHGRTREQAYRGPADWSYIRECKRVAKEILVIGNGDLFRAEDGVALFEQTGCDALLVARGLMGQPWIIEDLYRLLGGEPALPRSAFTIRSALLEHLDYILAYQNPQKALFDLRRIGCWFLKAGRGMRDLRHTLNTLHSVEEVRGLIEGYDWEGMENKG